MAECARERPGDEAKCAYLLDCGVWHCGTGTRAVVWRIAPVLGRVLGRVLGDVATRSDVGNDEESLISDFFCPSGELGEREDELGPLYKGDIQA